MVFSERTVARGGASSRDASCGFSPLDIERPLHTSHSRRLTSFALLFAAASALACYQEKKPAQSASGHPASDTGASLGLQPVPATHDTAIREIDRFALTTTVFHQLLAAKRQLDQVRATNPEIEERMKKAPPPKDVTEAGARFDAEPKLHAALAQAGMTGKDFLLGSIAMSQAMKGFQLKALGKLDASKVPPVVMANINFVGAHMPEIMGSINVQPARRPAP